jgi:hypothetical protein
VVNGQDLHGVVERRPKVVDRITDDSAPSPGRDFREQAKPWDVVARLRIRIKSNHIAFPEVEVLRKLADLGANRIDMLVGRLSFLGVRQENAP